MPGSISLQREISVYVDRALCSGPGLHNEAVIESSHGERIKNNDRLQAMSNNELGAALAATAITFSTCLIGLVKVDAPRVKTFSD